VGSGSVRRFHFSRHGGSEAGKVDQTVEFQVEFSLQSVKESSAYRSLLSDLCVL
jgi:hypothetical protein